MDITIHNSKKTVSVSDATFDVSFNEPLVHQLVVSYMSAARAGTVAQKNRAAVSGGGGQHVRNISHVNSTRSLGHLGDLANTYNQGRRLMHIPPSVSER